MTDNNDEEYKIVDDDPPMRQFNGKGFKIVVKSVAAPQSEVDPERDVTEFFKDVNGKCLICELRCSKDDCTKCDVPRYSEKITSKVMENITTHKSPPTVKVEKVSRPQ